MPPASKTVSLPNRTLHGKTLKMVLSSKGVKVLFPRGYRSRLASKFVTLAFMDVKLRAHEVYIDFLYVNTSPLRDVHGVATDEEVEAGKGLGKQMLCAWFEYAHLPSDMRVALTASSPKLKSIPDLTEEQVTQVFVNAENEGFETFDDWMNTKRKRQTFAAHIANNMKLVRYYERYGFKIDKANMYDPIYVKMKATVHQIVQACA